MQFSDRGFSGAENSAYARPKPMLSRRSAKRALYVSSPIGLGHVRRDLAIAKELRKIVPGLQVEWLAQDPVTRLLEFSAESIHPLSRRLASESRHIELESGEHELHAFHAIRRMDEVLIANFMTFQDAVEEQSMTSSLPTKRGRSTTTGMSIRN